MRTKEEQDAINKACKYHPKTKQELIKLVQKQQEVKKQGRGR